MVVDQITGEGNPQSQEIFMVVRLQPLEGLIGVGVFPRVAVADVSIAVDVVAHVLLVVQAVHEHISHSFAELF